MEKHTRSYAMVRTLMLGSATLAIVGVLFAIYQLRAGGPPVDRNRGDDLEPPMLASPTAGGADGEAAGGAVSIGEGVHLPGGSRGVMRLYDPQSDQPTAVLSYRRWQPVGGSEDQFDVIEPRISLRTPNGQLVEITARSGLIQLKMDADDRPDLRHGMLMGDVEIKVDRLDDKQRAALPEEERDNPGPGRLVVIKLDDLDFDRQYARLTTSGRFSIDSAEAHIEGEGLALRYNEVSSSVEHLEIKRAGSILVRGMGQMLKVGLPGEDETTQPAEPAAAVQSSQVEPQPPPEPPSLPNDGIPVLGLDQEKTAKAHPTIRYQATFTGDVLVRETQGGEVAGELVAEVLEVLFDFGQGERDAARARTAAPGTADGASDAPEGAPEQVVEMTVTWSGPLTVAAVNAEAGPEAAEATDGNRRMQVTATGADVRVEQADRGTVHCQKLVYDEGTERLWLYGQPDRPAVIDASDGGHLEGPRIALDVKAGTARIAGPGRMSDRRSRRALLGSEPDQDRPKQSVDIRFQDEVNVSFASATVETMDPVSGEEVSKERRYLENAVFLGAVSMRQGADLIRGQRVELTFGQPRRKGAFADNIRRLQAEGDVALVHGEESIRCRRIDVEMGIDAGGHVAPRLARAYQDVSANQGDRTITAGERMTVLLGSYRVPWDLAKAKLEAMRRGIDQATVDWQEQQAKYELEPRFRAGVERLDAYGGVTVHDPQQNLHVDADSLECTFGDGRRIDKALVKGNDVSPAQVELNDYAITGREVDLDVSAETADVPGRGRLAFKSRRDLDGRVLDRAVPVVVTWTERMHYRGAMERAVITGSVHAATEQSTFDCGELTIRFADRDDPDYAAAYPEPPTSDGPRIDWWVFTPLVERAAGLFKEQRDDRYIEDDFNKEPVYILATGGAVALTSKLEPGTGRVLSRGRIAGPKILVDLRAEAMTVEGAGNLLIEDYELPASARQDATDEAELRTPFGGLGVGSPSQTFLRWEGEMTYYFGQRATFFERGVEMAHRSGTEIILGRDMIGDVTYSAALDAGVQQGRKASLTCEKLVVQFHTDQEAGPDVSGAGDMSGYELSRFEASGRVHFQDAGIVVMAHKVAYDAPRKWLTIRGGDGAQATIYDTRKKFQEIKADVIDWNRQTGRIYAPKASVIGR